MKRKVDWSTAKEINSDKGKRLIIFVYSNDDVTHPQIIHGDRVKVYQMTESTECKQHSWVLDANFTTPVFSCVTCKIIRIKWKTDKRDMRSFLS